MTKLDEIETIMNGGGWADLLEDDEVNLLIRAVRQLGAIARAVNDGGSEKRLLVLIDPDVLELIESPISVVANEGTENKDR